MHRNATKTLIFFLISSHFIKAPLVSGESSTEDFIRLHALALEGYDAIAYYDADCEFQVRIVGNHGKPRKTPLEYDGN